MAMAGQELEERLDRNYRYQRHVYDLTRRYYLLGRERCLRELNPPAHGSVLEMGCGTARNLILASKSYPQAELYGVDLSREMLDVASRKIARHKLSSRIALAHGDATTFDPAAHFGIRRFDRIFFSYSLSMIPPWEQALAHAATLLAPGGSLHVVDFGPGTALPPLAKRALRNWLQRFHVTPRDQLGNALAEVARRNEAHAEISLIYRTYAVQAIVRMTPRATSPVQ